MANWTVAFTDRTDGVILLSDINLAMKPITSTGSSFNTVFTPLYACYTSGSEFTVNNNSFTVQNDDNGFEEDGGATITLDSWTPNSKQMDVIKTIPELKKYRYFFKININNRTTNHVIVTFNPDITVNQPTPPTPPQPITKTHF